MNDLLAGLAVLETRGDPSSVEVTGVSHDSRGVRPGDLFCCVPGSRTDGHDHAAEAVQRGATGLLVERFVDEAVPQARLPQGGVRPAMAPVAAAFFGHPGNDLVLAGVTGTNGKTTVTHLLGHVLRANGRPTAVLGTLSGPRTTPEAPELQARLAAWRDGGRSEGRPRAVAMEVSSHALVEHRVDALRFDVAVFTNLSHDHLDFHGSMEAYFAAKASLFSPARTEAAVVWADDPYGARLVEAAEVPTLAVGSADAKDVEVGLSRTSFTWRGHTVTVALTGRLQVANVLLAAEAAVRLGLSPLEVAAALATAPAVPGRLEVVVGAGPPGPPFSVLVDYAHTPAALEAALRSARDLAAPGARVLVVFGCGGERDPSKRPAMGEVAARLADVVVVTSDNPRGEDPASIAEAVLAGVPAGAASATAVPGRPEAVQAALEAAGPGDVVVVAGKGHERVQEVAGRHLAMDDRQLVRQALGLERATGAGGTCSR